MRGRLRRIEVALHLPRRAALAIRTLAQADASPREPRIRVVPTLSRPDVSVRFDMEGAGKRAQPLLAWLLASGSAPGRRVPRLVLEDVFGRLSACPLVLDHVGLTAAARPGAAARLESLRALLAPRARVIAHPGARDSLFVVPGALAGADPPKFELALSPDRDSTPAVQLDIRTPYSLDRLRSLFAPGERLTVPVLQDHAVSVLVKVPWRRMALRVDLRARPVDGEPAFTDWLLQYGSRGRAASLSRARPT